MGNPKDLTYTLCVCVVLWAGCNASSSSDPAGCTEGNEGCACYPNGTCNTGLSCDEQDNTCFGTGLDSGGSNGSGGAGGGSSAGGSSAGGSSSAASGGASGSSAGGATSSGGAASSGGASNTSSAGASGSTSSGGSSGGASSTTGTTGTAGSTGCGSTRTIPVTFRDFNESHPDFEPGIPGTAVEGLVEPLLGSDGKPVPAVDGSTLANITSAASFSEWYVDSAVSSTIQGELVLFDDGQGGFVNRYGANGEQWFAYGSIYVCNSAGLGCDACVLSGGQTCFDPCPDPIYSNYSCGAVEMYYDGNPLFFPIDDHPDLLADTRYEAKVPEQYGYAGWPWELDVLGMGPLHNFHFTTEIHFEFVYDASKLQRFSFLGDDDLWVFLNEQLIIDLGGHHVPLAGEFTIDTTLAATYGLVDGERYEIAIFHAERQTEGSSFMVRLEGFEDCQ